MAPMRPARSPGGVPGADVAASYRRRAESGVGLIVTERTYPPTLRRVFDPNVPRIVQSGDQDRLQPLRRAALRR
jgi:2,4-dienoyl-CoA reductase-like NADH-dependent reductase (Old Yellow Enzyme family)